MNIFINDREQRLRAGWRILLQFIIMIGTIFLSYSGLSLIIPGSLALSMAIPFFIGVIFSIWVAARYFDKRSYRDYGINFDKRWAKEYGVGVVIAAIALSIIFLIEWSAGWLTITDFGWNVASEFPFWINIGSFLLSMLLVGFHEELFSRGYQILNLNEGLQYPALGQSGAMVIAILLTSSLFGALHMSNPNASALSTFNIILAGVVLAIPYILTGSLALSAGLHFSWNFVMAGIYGFPVSGMEISAKVLHIRQAGPELWTGGAFGPEAGILGLGGMAIITLLSIVYIWQAGYELSIAEIFTKRYQPAVRSDEQSP